MLSAATAKHTVIVRLADAGKQLIRCRPSPCRSGRKRDRRRQPANPSPANPISSIAVLTLVGAGPPEVGQPTTPIAYLEILTGDEEPTGQLCATIHDIAALRSRH